MQDLLTSEQEVLDRIHPPSAEREEGGELPLWLRTCYEPASEHAWSTIETQLQQQYPLREGKWGYPSLFSDSTLYDFGAEYERTFLRMPQLLESAKSVAEYEEETQRTLQEGIEDQENEG